MAASGRAVRAGYNGPTLNTPPNDCGEERRLLWAAGIYALLFTLGLAVFVFLIVVLPERYFVEKSGQFWVDKPPAVRWLAKIGKNLLGVVVIAIGVVLSLPGIPGQGVLTMVIGAMLLDIPGKRRLERLVIRRRGVLRPINRIRSWFGRRPLVVEEGRGARG